MKAFSLVHAVVELWARDRTCTNQILLNALANGIFAAIILLCLSLNWIVSAKNSPNLFGMLTVLTHSFVEEQLR